MIKRLAFLFILFSSIAVAPGLVYADEMAQEQMQAIDINSADAATLEQLKGVGETKAQAIIDWREENGPFTSAEQLLAVNGIGEATLEDIREQIVLQ